MIYHPSKRSQVDCYVDADFAGLWGHENSQDPICVKSRTGYVITLANCPIHWVSKLQTEVALSTLHSEYVALSQSTRDLLPMRQLLQEVTKALGMNPDNLTFTSKSTVYEDNSGAIIVATSPRMTLRSKHIAVKYHWFREHVNKEFDIKKIDGEEQLADIFTKGLQGKQFFKLRKLLCGW